MYISRIYPMIVTFHIKLYVQSNSFFFFLILIDYGRELASSRSPAGASFLIPAQLDHKFSSIYLSQTESSSWNATPLVTPVYEFDSIFNLQKIANVRWDALSLEPGSCSFYLMTISNYICIRESEGTSTLLVIKKELQFRASIDIVWTELYL